MAVPEVPDIVIGRLPLYLRALSRMQDEGKPITSSQELGDRLGISSAQIRKDLSQFGEFGKQGTGYNVEYLADQLRRILHVDKVWAVALIGAGDLGRAVAHYGGFEDRGLRIECIFDSNPNIIGKQVANLTVSDTKDIVQIIREKEIRVAMLAVPASVAQNVSDQVVEAGVTAILSYAPTAVQLPDNVRIQYIDPVVHVQRMTYYLV
jgi:redox-sensing transcriptional repressor